MSCPVIAVPTSIGYGASFNGLAALLGLGAVERGAVGGDAGDRDHGRFPPCDQGEQLGSPLAHIFRAQADMLRIKRTQRAETIAGEAGVKMLLPAILVMASTVIVILGPFILGFIYGGLFIQ